MVIISSQKDFSFKEMLLHKVVDTTAKLLIIFFSSWTIYVSFSAIFGTIIFFPFNISEAEPIPYHRWQSVRVAVFLTFAFFGIKYLFNSNREYLPIQFLEIYLKFLTIVGVLIFYKSGVQKSEYLVILFFGFCSIILHLACRKKYRKYFARKGKKFS